MARSYVQIVAGMARSYAQTVAGMARSYVQIIADMARSYVQIIAGMARSYVQIVAGMARSYRRSGPCPRCLWIIGPRKPPNTGPSSTRTRRRRHTQLDMITR